MKIERVVLDHAQIRGFLKGPEVARLVGGYGQKIAANAGAGYESNIWLGKSRVIGSAYTGSPKAMANNAKHHTLLRALWRARNE